MYNVLNDRQTLRGLDWLEVEERVSVDLARIHAGGGISAAPIPQLRVEAVLQTPTVYAVDKTCGTA